MVSSVGIDIFLALVCAIALIGVFVLSRSELRPELDLEQEQPVKYLFYPGRLMRQAGFVPTDFVWIYWPVKIFLFAGSALVFTEISADLPGWVMAVSLLVTLFSTDLFLLQRRKLRKLRVQANLSFFVDLVNAYLSSGISLFRSVQQAGEHGFEPSHPLAVELKLIAMEIQSGESFQRAMGRLYERTGVRQLQGLSASFEVGHAAGASMSQNLSRQAEAFREQQEEMNRKLISQKSITLLFALILVGLPMFGVIVLFPAAVKLAEIFELLDYII
ncbi:type II secretion system F family protein [Marinobacter litoralis]|uniref:type II secretion system F family protein n=1 Tax=Marinobacter litoralis TaxID=187981 RepID=UPI0018EE2B55|nr:type II secretion system F family protein [Marinobacter litoralis]MBJ6138918.1 type II secretion system F family protein [Marinobacter litoralis]